MSKETIHNWKMKHKERIENKKKKRKKLRLIRIICNGRQTIAYELSV